MDYIENIEAHPILNNYRSLIDRRTFKCLVRQRRTTSSRQLGSINWLLLEVLTNFNLENRRASKDFCFSYIYDHKKNVVSHRIALVQSINY